MMPGEFSVEAALISYNMNYYDTLINDCMLFCEALIQITTLGKHLADAFLILSFVEYDNNGISN